MRRPSIVAAATVWLLVALLRLHSPARVAAMTSPPAVHAPLTVAGPSATPTPHRAAPPRAAAGPSHPATPSRAAAAPPAATATSVPPAVRAPMVAPPPSATPPAPAPSHQAAPTPTPPQRFTGTTADTRYGAVQVAITVQGGRITDVQALQLPNDNVRSRQLSSTAGPQLRSEALQAQSANIDTVSGATYTSDGYRQSLQSAIDQAHLG